jgi:hypothetical protein
VVLAVVVLAVQPILQVVQAQQIVAVAVAVAVPAALHSLPFWVVLAVQVL